MGYALSPSGAVLSSDVLSWSIYEDLQTYTGNLLPFRGGFQRHLEDIVFDLGGAEALNEGL